MTLLEPVSAAVAAALTVPALLAFYLLKLRRRPVRVSTTLFWERAVKDAQGNAPWRMLRPNTQLLLQLLALALLLVAFAHPVVGGAGGGRTMLVIDRSASMAATDANGQPRLEAARERARERLRGLLGGGGEVMLVALAAEATALTPWTSDRGVLLGALDAIEQSDQPASTDALVELANAASGINGRLEPQAGDDAQETQSPDDTAGPLSVLIVSDGALPTPTTSLPANVGLELDAIAPEPDGTGNAGVVTVAARRQYEDPVRVRVFARVSAVGQARRPTAVRLALDGRVVDEASADLSGEGDEPTQASVSLSVAEAGRGVLTVLLPGQDLLAADDSASLWLRGAGRPRVLLVIPDGEVVDPDRPGPAWLVAVVLEAMELGELRIIRLGRYEQLASAGTLPFDVAVFDRCRPAAPPPMGSLHLGPPPPIEGLGIRWTPEGELDPTPVVAWRRTHPLLRDLAMDQLRVADPRMARLGPLERAPDGSGPGRQSVQTLASGKQGPLIVQVEGGGVRRVWVGFEPARSNWPKLVSFPLFLAEAIDTLALRGVEEAASGARTTEPATIALAQPRSAVALAAPWGQTLRWTFPTPRERPVLGVLERAGVYLLEEATPADQRAVAVNLLDERESRLSASADPPAGIGGVQGGSRGRALGQRELWPWFVLAAVALLAVEWLLSARGLGR